MDYELIFWLILGIIALVFLIGALIVPNEGEIEITSRKLKDWERREKQWK
jgi:hypothetical protein